MPYFKTNNKNVLFIHIPKTGGTSVEHYLSEKYSLPLNHKNLYGIIQNNEYININSSLQHLSFKEIIKNKKYFNLDLKNLKIFTIVRNPYDRIISQLFFDGFLKINDTKKKNI